CFILCFSVSTAYILPCLLLSLRRGQISGDVIHLPGKHKRSHKDHQDSSCLHRISDHVHMFPEKSEKLSSENSCCQKWQDKSQSVHPDEQESLQAGLGASRHQEYAGQRRSHTGCPRKTESKSHDQRSDRGH